MRIRLRQVRQVIKEAVSSALSHRQMPFEDLLRMQQQLDERLVDGTIGQSQYDDEWNNVLHTYGWSKLQYERELDRRWDYIDVLRAIAPPRTDRSN